MSRPTSFRVVLVGNSLIVKTSIIRSLVRGEFDPTGNPTVGAVFHMVSRDIHGRRIVMQIWDTAGTEKYRSIGPIYYRNAPAALAIFNLQNDDFTTSFDSWIVNVKRNSTDPIIYVVGNKTDLVAPTPQIIERIQAFAAKYNAEFFLVSAKTGDKIKKLFDAVFEGLYKTLTVPMDNITVEEVSIEREEPQKKCC
jgi:small GTP-binding protein